MKRFKQFLMETRSTYRVVLKNEKGDRLTWFPKNHTHAQPYDQAEHEVNNHPDHKKYGPWKAHSTERNT